jgi:hypothetical protein
MNKLSGLYYSLVTIGTVPRAYEEMEGRKIKIKKLKVGKCNTKQNTILKNYIFF